MIEAVIFDMNGVIVDNEMFHEKIIRSLTEERGVNLSGQEYNMFFHGKSDEVGFGKFVSEYFPDEDPAIWVREKQKREKGLIESSFVEVPGSRNLVKLLSQHFKLGLVSGAIRSEVNLVVAKFGLRDYFQTIISMEDVKKGKPDPEPYLLASKLLNTMPENCLVIEDAYSGLLSAKEAGMRCIILNTPYSSNADFGKADLIVNSINDISLEKINGLGRVRKQ